MNARVCYITSKLSESFQLGSGIANDVANFYRMKSAISDHTSNGEPRYRQESGGSGLVNENRLFRTLLLLIAIHQGDGSGNSRQRNTCRLSGGDDDLLHWLSQHTRLEKCPLIIQTRHNRENDEIGCVSHTPKSVEVWQSVGQGNDWLSGLL